MNHILRNKYLPTFAFWPYPCPFFTLVPKSVKIKVSKFTNLLLYLFLLFIYINIIIKYQLITPFRAYQRIFGRASLVAVLRSNQIQSSAHAQISPPSFCFSLLSLLSLPWPSSDRRETKKRKKTNLSKNTFVIG